MPIAKGTRLGPYLVVAPLGEGGMGEVYRAEDTRLGRPVALKVLPAEVVQDPAARTRFEREARLIGRLQHPNICVLHDVGYDGATPFLVMELLEGRTLEQRLRRGPLAPTVALTIGAQIADALEAAHRQGVAHRDLKPANVMLVRGGANDLLTGVKLLDFGIARPVVTVTTGREHAASAPTRDSVTAAVVSDAFAVAGTLPYMAPEQLSERSADHRTDLWALGCVLYEMLSGARPFAAATNPELVAAILERPLVPLADRVPGISPHLSHVVMRCLERNPEQRWQSSRDVAAELEWARQALVSSVPATRVRGGASSALAWSGWAAAFLLALVCAFLFTGGRRSQQAPAPIVRLSVPAPLNTAFLGGRSAPYLALSPDGRTLAFVPTPFRRSAGIWVRGLDSHAARPLPETTGATYPFWSPDSTRLGFFADGKLKIVDMKGGRPLTICDAPAARGGTWNSGGDIVFTPRLDGPLYRVSASGGTPTAVTSLDTSRAEFNHKLPTFLPDGRRFLFFLQAARVDQSGLYLGSLDSRAVHPIVGPTSRAEYAGGFLWYVRDGALVAHPFDPEAGQVSGEPIPTGNEVASRNTIIGDALFSIAADGTAASWNGPLAATTELTWYDRAGRRLGTLGDPDRHSAIALSPDARTVAAEVSDREGPFYNVWTIDTASGVKTRVTSGSLNWGPVWSPDGQRIAYGTTREGPSQVWLRGANGTPTETRVWRSSDFTGPTDWFPDGSGLALIDVTHYRVGLLSMKAGAQPQWVSDEAFVEGDGRISPDGRWLAYTSNESGSWDVYLKPLPALDRKWRVSRAGGSGPMWRRDSAELYFQDTDQYLMSVPVLRGAVPVQAAPARLFALPIVPSPPGIDPRLHYAPTRRGDRFLVNEAVDQGHHQPITIVLNQLSELRRPR